MTNALAYHCYRINDVGYIGLGQCLTSESLTVSFNQTSFFANLMIEVGCKQNTHFGEKS